MQQGALTALASIGLEQEESMQQGALTALASIGLEHAVVGEKNMCNKTGM